MTPDPITANRVKERAARGESAVIGWLTIPSPFVAEVIAGVGFDGVLIDMQHGLIGYEAMTAMVTAANARGAPAMVRVPVEAWGMVGRALDAGAVGIICPMIESGAAAKRFVTEAKYPPIGRRSWGPARPRAVLSGDAYAPGPINETVMTAAMVETEAGLGALDDILATDGIDAVFIGPNDLSLSLTRGTRDVEDPKVGEAMESIREAAARHGKIAGAYANTTEIAKRYRAEGFNFIAVGSDLGFMRAEAERTLARARGD